MIQACNRASQHVANTAVTSEYSIFVTKSSGNFQKHCNQIKVAPNTNTSEVPCLRSLLATQKSIKPVNLQDSNNEISEDWIIKPSWAFFTQVGPLFTQDFLDSGFTGHSALAKEAPSECSLWPLCALDEQYRSTDTYMLLYNTVDINQRPCWFTIELQPEQHCFLSTNIQNPPQYRKYYNCTMNNNIKLLTSLCQATTLNLTHTGMHPLQ